MTDHGAPAIYVAVPVWRGEDVVEETLRSLLAQTCESWRAVISVDDADETSAARCRPFLADSRITMVMQPDRLGWARNLNWLMARCDAEFFVYWQQDDLCDPNYLDTLLRHAGRHPEAACVFADVQWFGARRQRVHGSSVTGSALQRMLTQIETMSFLPFRGLVRRQALVAAGPLRLEVPEAAFEDLVWTVRLAREGELHAVDGTLYFKRAHAHSTHGGWMRWPPVRRRAAWIECAMGVIEAAMPALPQPEWPRLLEAVVGRFALARPGRGLSYDPSTQGPAEVAVFAADLATEAWARFGVRPAPGGAGHDAEAAALLRRAAMRERVLADMAEALASGAPVHFSGDAAGIELLGPGWSTPESWGTWSADRTATMHLPPLPGHSLWRATIEGAPFVGGLGPGQRRRIAVDAGGGAVVITCAMDMNQVTLEVDLAPAQARTGSTLRFTFADAVAPWALGLSVDTRVLGLGVTTLGVAPR